MGAIQLRTERLVLVSATVELLQAELTNRARFEKLLGAHVPPHWPPPLNDEASLRWTLELLGSDPREAGWASWYFLHREHGALLAVGNGGFKGKPDADGAVEVGYSILPDHHRHGFAPEAVRALVGWAFSHREVARVLAHTLPSLLPSIRVLEKCDFDCVGPCDEEGVIRYALERDAYERGSGAGVRKPRDEGRRRERSG